MGWIVWSLFLSACVVSGGPEPMLETSLISISTVQGTNVILPCNIRDMDTVNFRVLWVAPGGSIISLNNRMLISDRRFRLTQPYSGAWNMQLHGARSEDSGTYSCQLNTVPVQTKKVNLHVQVPARISYSGNVDVKVGDALTLTCNRLVKPGIMRSDEGVYSCKATNGVMAPAREDMIVNILFAPEVHVPNARIAQYKNKDVSLECEVTARPPATVTWHHQSTPLDSNWKYHIESFTAGGTVIHTLTVRQLQKFDFGDYICFAANTAGTFTQVIKVSELVRTIPTPSITTTDSPTTKTSMFTPSRRPPKSTTLWRTITFSTAISKPSNARTEKPIVNTPDIASGKITSNDAGSKSGCNSFVPRVFTY
ncbi:LACH-like protein [Mya arenaria]|uniref:LACH-like protein n=1 Tax=Mya arenaria TaxID=6604 RepID=A0ABY7DWM0_MYAAR|nr:LACH-like protein [Mya arenaria]